MKAWHLVLLTACFVYGASVVDAAAGQRYGAHYYVPPAEDPYALAESPQVGFVFMRPSDRCEYPNGWTSSDFSRNLNGVPRSGQDLLATGCGTYEPLAD